MNSSYVPDSRSISVLREAALGCHACDLYRRATQTVFGAGSKSARMVIVGEQPGDAEDRQGQPFVGPAGRLLDKALLEAGIEKSDVYVTNAVKHFKFEERGKRRIHQKPNGTEVRACRPWLESEINAIRPELLVALGVTATQALLAKKVAIKDYRAHFLDHPWSRKLFVTIHPSAILRARDEDREREYREFVKDWKAVREWLDQSS